MNPSRRHFLLSSAAPLLAQKSQPAGPRPNVLLILADDVASWMLGCAGNKEVVTPNIDLLARSGVRFQSSYAASVDCAASRATLFTGRFLRQHGLQDAWKVPETFVKEVMISEVLAQAGYQCGYVGKWGMGNDGKPGRGYQYTCTLTGAPGYTDPEISVNGDVVKEKGYLTEIMTRHALEFLDKQAPANPFFLTTAYLNSHTPYDGHPQKYYDQYAKTSFDTIGWERPAANARREKEMLKDTVGNIRKCAAAVTALDDQIPLLLKKLHEKKLWENTLVIFTSDNGYLLGRHGLWSNGLASDPINMFEEVVQVPMIWSWPGRTPTETMRPEMVSLYDLVPSLCEATGTTAPDRNLCGRSFLPVATGRPLPKKQPWKTVLFGQLGDTEMACDTRYKLVVRNEGKGPNDLFDLENDARERVNQYDNGQYVSTRQRLEKDLADWRKRTA